MKRVVSSTFRAGVPENERMVQLRTRVSKCSTEPGIYRWIDGEGTVLYVGKAKNLRARLRSYVASGQQGAQGPWKESMLAQVADFDVTVTNTELEALILETNLIKQLKPKYNVLMKDDKNYVYVRVTTQDPYPRVDVVRRMEDDGAKYFGPKTNATQVHQVLTVLRRLYPFRTCRMSIEPVEKEGIPLEVVCKNKDRPTPCLDAHMEQCIAPCVAKVTPAEYRARAVDGVLRFWKGDHEAVSRLLEEKMRAAAAAKQFEQAGTLRDQIKLIASLQEKVIVSDTSMEDADVVGTAVLSGKAQVILLQKRGGKLIGENSYALTGRSGSVAEVLAQFLPQYYSEAADFPDTILLSEEPEEKELLEEWISTLRGKKVQLKVPERGTKSQLLELAQKNAQEKVRQQEAKWESEARNTEDALAQLQQILALPAPPKRIEGYDISHLGGTETVGSMVVFHDGRPNRDHYRSFTIRSLRAGDVDDYRSLQEVLSRRAKYLAECVSSEQKAWEKRAITFGRIRKDERTRVREVAEGHPGLFPEGLAESEDCVVARAGEEFVGFAALHEEGGLLLLAPPWADPRHAGLKLEHALCRSLLKKVKKGKIYAAIHPSAEQAYSALGFRYVIEPPEALLPTLRRLKEVEGMEEAIAVVWDAKDNREDKSLTTTPDLIVIDGGKGQLSAVESALRGCGVTVPLIGLAKREEEVFVPGRPEPVAFPPDSPAKFLLMRLRDEAHRSANRHREARIGKHSKMSLLDSVPGIGPLTKTALLQRFGSVAVVREASDAELKEILTEAQLAALRTAMQP